MAIQHHSVGALALEHDDTPPVPSAGRRVVVFVSVLLVAIALVSAISVLTNRMPARWDVIFYLDVAKNGISGNPNLTTPFAYRPLIPLTVGAVARLLHTDTEATFHAAA